MIKSLNKKFLPGVLALIFLLIMALSDAALPQESQSGEQNVLRRASLEWMQVGMQQYQSKQFTQAEQSFRRALVFQKYLTDAERNRLNMFLANVRLAISKEKQAAASPQTPDKSVEQAQPIQAAAVQPAAEQGPQQVKKVPDKTSSQPSRQQVQPVVAAKPSISKIDLATETPGDIVVVKKRSSGGKFMGLSAWLSENRREILIIGLPVLAVLVIVSKLQGKRKRPGRRVYENPVPATCSFIGVKLNGGRANGRSPWASATNPEQKSFTQSTEHWKKNAVRSPVDVKPFETNEIWPGRKDKFEDDSVIAGDERKLCAKCRQTKSLSDFHKDKSSNDGLAGWCKECKRQSGKNRPAAKS